MKTCPHCGAQISETAKFCSECGYNFNDSVITECDNQVSSAVRSSNNPNEVSAVDKKANSKERKAILPEVFLLLFVIAMAVLYFVPFAYFGHFFGIRINLFIFNIPHLDRFIKVSINIFQTVFLVCLVIAVVTALTLLIKGRKRNSSDNPEKANIISKILLIMLLMQIIYVVLAIAMVLYLIISTDFEIYIDSYFLIGFPSLCAIGTIIAMVKIKKKRNKEAAENLE